MDVEKDTTTATMMVMKKGVKRAMKKDKMRVMTKATMTDIIKADTQDTTVGAMTDYMMALTLVMTKTNQTDIIKDI